MKRFRIHMTVSYQTKSGLGDVYIGHLICIANSVDDAVKEALTAATDSGWPDADVSGVELLEGGLNDA
ncbi:hypothetical protein LCGC14_1386840 [marine sediment metagenome]|uniref:Uncharacterized protein n=1 Tax=marine sediment metagenome TaxID=412755 RepID=A0A0F9N2Q8_9ZZZZ